MSEPESASVRFEVLVNGQRICIAGLASQGTFGASVDWIKRPLERIAPSVKQDPEFSKDDWLKEILNLHISGLESKADEHVVWLYQNLSIGDEVVIRILPPGAYDAPPTRFKSECGLSNEPPEGTSPDSAA